MTTEVQNFYFPVPRHEANTLDSLNMSQSYEAGTLNFVPTMTPMLPGEAGRRLESDKAEETLEELEDSLEYIKCVGRCKRRRDGLTHAQRLRLNAVSRGAHGDALYGRTPLGGGSVHGALLAQQVRERRANRDRDRATRPTPLDLARQEAFRAGYQHRQDELAAALSARARKGAKTRKRKSEEKSKEHYQELKKMLIRENVPGAEDLEEESEIEAAFTRWQYGWGEDDSPLGEEKDSGDVTPEDQD